MGKIAMRLLSLALILSFVFGYNSANAADKYGNHSHVNRHHPVQQHQEESPYEGDDNRHYEYPYGDHNSEYDNPYGDDYYNQGDIENSHERYYDRYNNDNNDDNDSNGDYYGDHRHGNGDDGNVDNDRNNGRYNNRNDGQNYNDNYNAASYSNNFQRELELINQARAENGVAPLRISNVLMNKASIRAEEISRYYSHTRPDGSSCFTVLDGISYNSVGENIAAGQENVDTVFKEWMNSPGHRENILNPDYTEIGMGYYYLSDDSQNYGHYWVQLFKG